MPSKKMLLCLQIVVLSLFISSCSIDDRGDEAFVPNENRSDLALDLYKIGGFLPLDELPDDYSFEQARADGVVVDDNTHDKASEQLRWILFTQEVNHSVKEPVMVRTMRSEENEKQIIMDIMFDGTLFYYNKAEISYEGDQYTRHYDGGQYRFLTSYSERYYTNDGYLLDQYIFLSDEREITSSELINFDEQDRELIWVFYGLEFGPYLRQ